MHLSLTSRRKNSKRLPEKPGEKALSIFRETVRRFKTGGVGEPEKEAEILLTVVTGFSREYIYTHDPPLSEKQRNLLEGYVVRRLKGEPLQYITGRAGFYGREFSVGRGVLIPRPETEVLVEEAIKIIRSEGWEAPAVLDLCTGSGCVAITIGLEIPGADVTGVDISDEALGYAELNKKLYGAENVRFLKGDLFMPVQKNRFDIILSNPPYVRSTEYRFLQREVREYEPEGALLAGKGGVDVIERILSEAPRYIMPHGYVLLEVGKGQAKEVKDIALRWGFIHVETVKDLSGIERVVVFRVQAGGK